MAEFLKSLVDKFLDFFNIGRAVSIFIPGALVSFALLMLLSLVFFPVKNSTGTAGAKVAGTAQKTTPAPRTAGKDDSGKPVQNKPSSAPAPTAGASAAGKQEGSVESKAVQGNQEKSDPREALGRQLASDFNRVASHYWVVALLSLITGILLYEIGNVIIVAKRMDEKMQLFRFKETQPLGGPLLVPDTGNEDAKVGLIYFAPYLKEDFTGKENYYNFLIAEYYRFLEFSAVMPLSVLLATLIAVIYYRTACCYAGACYQNGAVILLVLIMGLSVYLFYTVVFDRVFTGYRKASADLIKGITDVKNKGLIK
jgi:hypothetical protein